ncbi:catechol 2,3-dioxygenase-like lactoylglutathione lyase family enzyme [Cryobacterium mesophilum]|uniref:VOC family protein n=1 Tax=Terrimesophilobacter mesophilus TaxID=433647 RepID=A0A4R8VB96_9MICO|nr:VOC family protein [Terrimesophilobacter mesophilus]MBB5633341.1 catechol 2,3-dioxygenase-like lactoylglutathione lyase family enzyme [Terrimesophilobacter mesophilus]TFB80073.1 VOC family protein [Terrimesophilobacter mesophilus]
MKIVEVTVDVRSAEDAAAFYGTVLGLPVSREPGAAVVKAGRTRLVFRDNAEAQGCHHFAFTIPANSLTAAKHWVADRADILAKGDDDEFEYGAGWNARSFYFAGPEGSVLEFIIRRDLCNDSDGDFTAADIECVSEVGVAVPHVLATVDLLAGAGIEPYGLTPRDRFAPVGTIDGLIILVTPDRPWFPADDLLSKQSRILIDATDAHPGVYPLGEAAVLTVGND